MNDCLYCLIYGDGKHPGECLSINSEEGRKKYEEYSDEVDVEVNKIQERWRKKLERENEE